MGGHDPTASGVIGVLANAAVVFVGSALVVPTPTLGKRGSRWTDAFPGGLDRAGMADRFGPEVMAGRRTADPGPVRLASSSTLSASTTGRSAP